ARDRRGRRAARPAPGRAALDSPAQPVRRPDERDSGRPAAPPPRRRRERRPAAPAFDRRDLRRPAEHRMREQVEQEATAAAKAVAALNDDAVTQALERAP